MERLQTIEALGALKLLSGGSASLAAVDDLHQATGRDLNLVVGQKHNATVGGDMEEKIQGLRESVSGISQHLTAPLSWVGSEDLNLFRVVCELIDLLQQMNNKLSTHTHLPTAAPSQSDASFFSSSALRALGVYVELKK